MTTIPIVKMSGSGNLFVVVDNRERRLNGSLKAFARQVCEREKTDGLLLVEEPDRPGPEYFKMHFFNPDGSEDLEFIELQNTGGDPMNLLGIRFTDGIEFTFPDFELGPGEHVVIVSDLDAFQTRYGAEVNHQQSCIF